MSDWFQTTGIKIEKRDARLLFTGLWSESLGRSLRAVRKCLDQTEDHEILQIEASMLGIHHRTVELGGLVWLWLLRRGRLDDGGQISMESRELVHRAISDLGYDVQRLRMLFDQERIWSPRVALGLIEFIEESFAEGRELIGFHLDMPKTHRECFKRLLRNDGNAAYGDPVTKTVKVHVLGQYGQMETIRVDPTMCETMYVGEQLDGTFRIGRDRPMPIGRDDRGQLPLVVLKPRNKIAKAPRSP